MHCEHAVLAK